MQYANEIFQWRNFNTETTTSWPIAFSTVYSIAGIPGTGAVNRYENFRISSLSASSFAITMSWSSKVSSYVIAIGI